MRYLQPIDSIVVFAIDVAQWGAGGRRFKSSRPDQMDKKTYGASRKSFFLCIGSTAAAVGRHL
ncbi:hypothetical protein BN2476_1130002 [Paraburkholderia piptadeniae]|uniref:Uncharacterized protein n=1 Tax=Paraburkholderia piptadeniae TaxID=1701573 RepID=A0A1N7SUX6_9BURK|nr:hypothetical protein BN2476_1130002 [Paraburkholderia piptadeniae]